MQLLNGVGFDRLDTAIQAANLRQGVISNNIANVDTPYFKRSSVSFESMLQAEMNDGMPALQGRRTNVRHFVIGPTNEVPGPVVGTDQSTAMNNNQNNVDIDSEMTKLAENQLRYNAYVEQMNYLIKMKRTAVEGR
ncbi:Flagellar basal body rod protein FlgB [compost metagenome]|uniref:Flagellar basal body rod protein FlgB n=1 Tax=Paenibacillus timonensis TaxID=225915 RepID=A0ABW3SC92_9BACL|nr:MULTISPECIES: flagellar basal body rod protein FlgB [Paenibacillus]MCH1640577.1 flagellar basal body rod protein FlgB [Paenibacillus timonensis]MDU2241813.1 flagellar basal body rod protein FlgB [Paenibacillus sp.]MUG87630.1 flagellar basal body rod protein FlgB [Paenibacillus timonensis]